jgi:hypothetical protein
LKPCSGSAAQRWDEVLVSVDGVPYVELANPSNFAPSVCLDTIGGAGSEIGTFPCADPNNPPQHFTSQTWKVN